MTTPIEGQQERVAYDPTMECPCLNDPPCRDPDHLAETARYWHRVSDEWYDRLTTSEARLSTEHSKRLEAEAQVACYRAALRRISDDPPGRYTTYQEIARSALTEELS